MGNCIQVNVKKYNNTSLCAQIVDRQWIPSNIPRERVLNLKSNHLIFLVYD